MAADGTLSPNPATALQRRVAAKPLAKQGAPTLRITRRAYNKAQTRQKVILAAAALFAEHGYAAVGIRDIAALTGMSTGAVFASFKDKAAVFTAATGRPAPEGAGFIQRIGDLTDMAKPDQVDLARQFILDVCGKGLV